MGIIFGDLAPTGHSKMLAEFNFDGGSNQPAKIARCCILAELNLAIQASTAKFNSPPIFPLVRSIVL